MTDEFDFSTGQPSDEMAEYLQMYVDETSEQLDALVESLLVLETQPTDSAQLNEAFRLIHSIKGSSAMMGLDSITALTHHLENHFERLRSGLIELDRASMALILRCMDYLRESNQRLRSGKTLNVAADLLDALDALENRGELAAPPVAAAPAERPAPSSHAAPPPPTHSMAPSGPSPVAAGAPSPGTSDFATTTAPHSAPSAPPDDTASARPAIFVREYHLAIAFEPNLALADLKAELILARLAEIGTVRETRPERSLLESIGSLPQFEILVSSEQEPGDVRAAADVDGVASIRVAEGVTQFPTASLATSAELVQELASAADAAIAPQLLDSTAPEVAGEAMPSAAAPAEAAATADSDDSKSKVVETVRVDIQRLDKLMNLAGELVVNKARFVQIAQQMSPAFKKSSISGRARAFSETMRRAVQMLESHAGHADRIQAAQWRQQVRELESEITALEEQSRLWEESRRYFGHFTEAIDQMTRVSNSLQRGVLDTRMVPVAPLFNRFKRVVRDIAVELGKQVQLEIRGEKTELDKRMIDELGDPLVHLVRNAIDHGIESAAVRAARHKPAAGTIRLEAAHSGNNVFISVCDDGGGIPIDKVRQRIVQRGLLPEVAAQRLSDREVIDYIWHPGFSTAEQISDISGRGVGMDIVKTRITELNGTIDIQHSAGQGTTFTIRLPLTLAIIRSLLFRLRHGVFAVPIDSVREIVSVPVEQIVTVHGRRTFEVRGEFIPLVDIDEVFDWHGVDNRDRDRKIAGSEPTAGRVNVVILQSAERTIGLKVDELQGGQDIVIKSLAENFIPIRGLSGATILGDGTVALLLDVGAVIGLTGE